MSKTSGNTDNPDEGQNGIKTGEINKKRQSNAFSRHGKSNNQFKGETPGMMGKVFRLQSEHAKKGEFEETMEALERYSGRNHPLDASALQVLFRELKTPSYSEPEPPKTASIFKSEE